MISVPITVIWTRRDSEQGVIFEQLEYPSLRPAMRQARRISTSSSFLFGQLLAPDGWVVASFAAGQFKFNDSPNYPFVAVGKNPSI